MIKTEDVLGWELKPGDIIWNQGYRWRVLDVVFDPKGNTGNQPRYCPRVEYAGERGTGWPGGSYESQPVSFGRLVDMTWPREIQP